MPYAYVKDGYNTNINQRLVFHLWNKNIDTSTVDIFSSEARHNILPLFRIRNYVHSTDCKK